MSDSMLRSALLVSAAMHGLFGVWVEVRGFARAPVFREIADSWTGPGIEVDAVSVTATGHGSDAPNLVKETQSESSDESLAKAPHVTHVTHAEKAAHAVVSTRNESARPHAVATQPTPTRSTTTNAASPATEAATASTASGDGAPSAAFGAQGLPVGVRHLPKAFTRALSIASRGDPRWLTLSPGPAGEAHVEIAVDDDGKLGELAYQSPGERDRLAPVVRHLLDNTRLLLESGHFSVDPTTLRAGVQRLRVRVEVIERTGASEPDGDPNELKELEYEAPTATKPGRGSFALNSGRRVIGWVYVE